jgi:hypothetical protein
VNLRIPIMFLLAIIPLLSAPACAADQETDVSTPVEDDSKSNTKKGKAKPDNDKYLLTQDEKKLLNKSTLSYRVNELKDLYALTAVNNNINVDKGYLIEDPMTLIEAVSFTHPYLQISVSELTEGDRDAIMKSIEEEQAKSQRYKSIFLTAMKFATDASFYEVTRNKHHELMHVQYSSMTQIFPFHMLSLENGKIRAPLIEGIGFSRELESKRTRREIRKRYRIERQAEVMNEPQTFMDFFSNLLTDKPKQPNVYMLPLNDEELKFWRKGILHGWVEGNRLGNEIIRSDHRMLVREFYGQLRFHYLSRANIISRPTSQNINIGTNANGMSVNIGETVFEITQLPAFNDNEMDWIAIPQVDDIFDKLTQNDIDELSAELDHPGDLR